MSLFAQFSFLQILDALTTLAFLSAGVQEGNPLVAYAMRMANDPLPALILVKIIAIAIGLYCWRAQRYRVLTRANWLFAGLVAWNLVALIVATRQIA